MNIFNRFSKSNKKAGRGSKSTIIDGKKVPDIIHWGETLLSDATDNREKYYQLQSGTTFSNAMKTRLLQFLGENWVTRSDIESDDKKHSWNFLFSIIEIQLAIILSNRPEIAFKPNGIEDVPLADLFGNIIQKEQSNAEPSYDEYQADRALTSKIYGHSIGCIGYTYLKNAPVGQHTFRVCDPLGVFWEYGKSSIYDSKFVIEVRVRNVSDVEDEFQVKLPDDFNQSTEIERGKYCIWDYTRGTANRVRNTFINECLTVDIWYQDNTKMTDRKPVFLQDENGQDILDEFGKQVQAQNDDGNLLEDRVDTLKYPGKRRIIFTGDHLLYDGDNPYKHKMIPYTGTKNYRVPFLFSGMSEMHQLEDVLFTIDDTVTQIGINNQLTGNNQVLVDKSALEEEQEVTNEPGAKFFVKPGKIHDAMEPVKQSPINPQAHNLYNMAMSAKDIISGVTSYVRGEAYAADSGVKVQSLDMVAQRRIAGPLWNLEHSIKREGLMILKNIRQFLPDSKLWRLEGIDGDRIEEIVQAGGNLQIMSNSDIILSMRDVPEDLEYDIIVSPVGEIPTNREAKLAMLIKLKQVMPDMPDWVLMKYIDIPDLAEEAQKREEEWKMMQQQLGDIQGQLEEERQMSQQKRGGEGQRGT